MEVVPVLDKPMQNTLCFAGVPVVRGGGGAEEWLAVKRLVAEVRAAGGTYRAYLHEHRKQLLMLRCLATKKGRATTTDPVMNFLVQLGDNGVIWKVLSFWPPPP